MRQMHVHYYADIHVHIFFYARLSRTLITSQASTFIRRVCAGLEKALLDSLQRVCTYPPQDSCAAGQGSSSNEYLLSKLYVRIHNVGSR